MGLSKELWAKIKALGPGRGRILVDPRLDHFNWTKHRVKGKPRPAWTYRAARRNRMREA